MVGHEIREKERREETHNFIFFLFLAFLFIVAGSTVGALIVKYLL